MTYSPRGRSGHRLRVQGVVTGWWPGKALCLKDATGSLLVRPHGAPPLYVGQRVEVAGFPRAGGYSPVLEQAVVRTLGPGVLSPPKAPPLEKVLSGACDYELIELEGTLEAKEIAAEAEQLLVLQTGNRTFRALVRGQAAELRAMRLKRGTLLRLTGVCIVQVDAQHRPSGFEMWLRSAQDVAVLRRPPWWTPVRLGWTLLVMAGMVVTGFGWIEVRRRRVAQRAEVVRQREEALEARYRDLFENANDVIFTCDCAGRLTTLNRAGEMILGYSREEACGREFMELVASASRDSARALLQAGPAGRAPVSGECGMIAKDGRAVFLELATRLDYQDGHLVGVKGVARDITARKEAQEALQRSEQGLRRSLEDRERLGRDLHDGIIQSIYAVGLGLEDCRRFVEQRPREAEAALDRIMTQLNGVIRDVRDFILGLEPRLLKGAEFREALDRVVRDFGPTHAARLRLEVDPQAAGLLDARQTAQALHIAREAISNSLRHANATSTTVRLHKENGCVRLEVHDDGRGFDMNGVASTGHGLRNIAARARELRARLAIVSQPAQGTTVFLDIPWRQDDTAV
jgi:PAS domain S-box-containing protein